MSRISSLILLIVPLKALIITDLNLKEKKNLLGFLALPEQLCLSPLVSYYSPVVVWADGFTGPAHKCLYRGGQKSTCLIRTQSSFSMSKPNHSL